MRNSEGHRAADFNIGPVLQNRHEALTALSCFPRQYRLACFILSNSEREISHLLAYLESSGCQFYRNGAWYDSRRAREHLERKYKYLLKENLVDSAETFIAAAATKAA
jgi:hypothetical protein